MSNRNQNRQPKQKPAHASSDAVGEIRCTDEALSYGSLQRDSEHRIVEQAMEIIYRRMERGDALTDPRMAGDYCKGKLHGLEREVFGVLFLDNRHRAIGFEKMFFGTVDGAEVYPREVLRAALLRNASAIIICHNHPSGNPEPSAADRAVTLRLRDALALVEIRLLDHFVIGDGAPCSLAARGWL